MKWRFIMTRSTPDRFSRLASRVKPYLKRNNIRIGSDPGNLNDPYWNEECGFYWYQLPKSRGSVVIAAYSKEFKLIIYNENGINFSFYTRGNKKFLSIEEELNIYELKQ